MKLQIYAEDTYCKALAVLAKKAARHWYEQKGGISSIKIYATPTIVSEMYTRMRSLVENAGKDGCGCVAFVVDREGPTSRHHRPQELQRIEQAFDSLCNDPPDQIKVMLIIAETCLESWLLADTEGLVEFAIQRKGKRPRHVPTEQHRTDRGGQNCRDHEHAITEIFQRVEKSLGTKRPRVRYDKRASHRIAEHIDPIRGSKWNKSLEYFCEMVPCKRDGCKDRQPARQSRR